MHKTSLTAHNCLSSIKLFVLEIKVAKIPKSTTKCGCKDKLVHCHDQISILRLGRLIDMDKSANSSCFCLQEITF